MLDKQVPEADESERPPPFNPEARMSWSSSSATDTNSHMLHILEHPPPFYDPNLDETVVWDENLSPERDNVRREETHADVPTTPRGENGDYVPSPTAHSSPTRMYWQSTKQAATTTWNKMKRFEEKHDISNKTRQSAKTVCKSTKRATVLASRQVKEFDEKHQVVHKSKQAVLNGTNYITKKCTRRPTM